MREKLKKLLEERASVWEEMKRNLEADDAEARGAYDAAEKRYDELTAEIERIERHLSRETDLEKVDRSAAADLILPGEHRDEKDEDALYERVFRSYLQGGTEELSVEDKRALRSRFVADREARAQGVGTGSAGGYTVPTTFRNVFIETLKYYGPMLQEAELLVTDGGGQLLWPTNDDTGNVGAILAENTQVTEQDVTLGQASLDAYMYTSKLVRVSFQLLQDREDFDTWLARKLGERIGRILNQHFTTGTGTSQPDGIVTSATVGVTGTGSFASTGGISYDDLVDLSEALDPAYGAAAGLKWMMHQTARKAVRKLKDSQNRPLWENSVQAGTPDSLLGYPVVINNDMATLAASSKSVLFGNIREAYVARLASGLTTLRLQERYADYLQVGFLAFQRADGTLQNANAVRVFTTTSTA